MLLEALEAQIEHDTRNALEEDLGSGDITAQLVPQDQIWKASVYTSDSAILCGRNWFDAVFRHLDASIDVNWYSADGDPVKPHQVVCTLKGPARGLLSGERTALNFLQTLSGTATIAHKYSRQVDGLNTRILDTRKTTPGLRIFEKYAVHCGGGTNHRFGLFDAVLIKDNHIKLAGGITSAIQRVREKSSGKIEVETTNLDEVREALAMNADIIMLDNMAPETVKKAVVMIDGKSKIEVSGSIGLPELSQFNQLGIDYISVGALTHSARSVDISMNIKS